MWFLALDIDLEPRFWSFSDFPELAYENLLNYRKCRHSGWLWAPGWLWPFSKTLSIRLSGLLTRVWADCIWSKYEAMYLLMWFWGNFHDFQKMRLLGVRQIRTSKIMQNCTPQSVDLRRLAIGDFNIVLIDSDYSKSKIMEYEQFYPSQRIWGISRGAAKVTSVLWAFSGWLWPLF